MGSVAFVNPGISDLLQTLTSLNSPALSSPNVVSALESAPTADVVQLSSAATQLEGIDALFGISTSATDDYGSTLLAQLENPGTASQSILANASPSDQAANADAAVQAELTQGLFGIANPFSSGSIFNTVG